MTIIVDYNPIIIASVSVAQNEVSPEDLDVKFIRHLFLNTILSIRKKFSEKYGDDVIIACDSGESWRKDFYPYYKASRAKSRKDSPLRWDIIAEALDTVRAEIAEYFPYRIISVQNAEADDIIAVLVKHFQTNELVENGILQEPRNILIVSNDKDFKQLQIYNNVEQYSPMFSKFLKESNPKLFLKEHIIRGDSGDGVPNFLSDDDVFVTEKRQKPIRQVKLDDWLKQDVATITENDSELLANWKRNETLINLIDCVPEELKNSILTTYSDTKGQSRSKLFNYFLMHKLNNLMKELPNF